MKKLICIALICTLSSQAHAGIWDSIVGFFGDDEEVSEVQDSTASAPTTPKTDEPKTSSMMETGLKLLPLLTQTLGVTDGQAKGGMGAILQTVQGLVSKSEYGALLQAIPGAQSLLAAAPEVPSSDNGKDAKSKLIGGAMDIAGKQGGALQQGAQLVSQFKSLGLSADMIPKFGETAGNFLTKTDKPEASQLLTSALSKLGGFKL